jgi:hypothetical protein
MIYCLGLGCLKFVFQVLSIDTLFLDLHSFSIKPQDVLIKTYRGGFLNSYPLPLQSPRVTQEASLLLELSITKIRGIYIEATMIGVPSCITYLLLGLGFSQTTNCAIIESTMLVGSKYFVTIIF